MFHNAYKHNECILSIKTATEEVKTEATTEGNTVVKQEPLQLEVPVPEASSESLLVDSEDNEEGEVKVWISYILQPATAFTSILYIQIAPNNATVPATIVSIEEVDSRGPDNLLGESANLTSSDEKTTRPERLLLKRRSSRLSTPTVAEEVDSVAPRPAKRRNQKKMIALFLESDYPRKK